MRILSRKGAKRAKPKIASESWRLGAFAEDRSWFPFSFAAWVMAVLFSSAVLPAVVCGAEPLGSAAGAKIESEIMWYTTMALDDSSVLVQKFKEKYPAINIKLFRANNSKLLERVLAESRAKAAVADVVSAGTLPIGVLKERALLAKYVAQESAAFPAGAKDADGYWMDIYLNTFNLVYNTTMVSSQEIPKTHGALLNPKWS